MLRRGLLQNCDHCLGTVQLILRARSLLNVCHATSPKESFTRRKVQKKPKKGEGELKVLNFEKSDLARDCPLVVLQPGKSKLFYDGSPYVYRGNIDRVLTNSQADMVSGKAMKLLDSNMKLIGWGVFNSVSMYSLRILQLKEEMASQSSDAMKIADVLARTLRAARDLRLAIGLPSSSTDAYRLVNSEGDRIPGLTVDIFGNAAVVSSSAAWIEQHQSTIKENLRSLLGIERVEWRAAHELLRLDGIAPQSSTEKRSESAPSEQAPAIHEPEGHTVAESQESSNSNMSSSSSHVQISENGVSYKVDLRHGQKTGFYADQRDSRALINSIAEGKSVLDLCCYTGGFALASAMGGAREVTGVDSSGSAISLAKENARLNSVPDIEFVHGAIEKFMQEAISSQKKWDVVILDPPKLAPRKSALHRAAGKYMSLNSAALRLVKPGGLFMTCSCSGAVAQTDSLPVLVKEAASIVGRKLKLLRTAGAAMDHPIAAGFPEGKYLTNLLYQVA